MRAIHMALAAATLAMVPSTARADDRAVVEAFYTQVLSAAAAADVGDKAAKVLAPAWESVGDYGGVNKKRDQFVGQVKGFGKLIPDLKWSIQEVIREGNRYVVRGRATGTPTGPFFSVPPSGKSFDIMTIDIHTVENGQIVRSYHVEDWAGAIRQLSAK